MTYIAETIKNVLFTIAIFVYVRNPIEKDRNKSKNVPYLDMI